MSTRNMEAHLISELDADGWPIPRPWPLYPWERHKVPTYLTIY